MAEAAAIIGLVASIGSLIDLSAKIVSRVTAFTAHSSDVPESFRSLADRLPLLTQTLQRIQSRAGAGHLELDIAKDLGKLVDSLVEQARFLQQCLEKLTPASDSSRLGRALKGLQTLAKDEKVRQTVIKVHNSIDVLILYQTTSGVELSDRILQQLTQLNLQPASTQQKLGLCLGRAPQIEPDAFLGRTVELRNLQEWLSPESDSHKQKVVSIVGVGGVGKTQLSLAFARENEHRYSSIFWINANDKLSVRQGMSALSNIIFPDKPHQATSGDQEDVEIDNVRRWLSEAWNKQWLIIFDNYDDPALPNVVSPTGFDIQLFFPFRAQGNILITTRSPKLAFSKKLMLQKVDDVDIAVAVLSHRAGSDLSADPDARRLATRLDGLPLALATAGTYLGQTSSTCLEYLKAYESAWIDLHGPESESLLEYENRTLSSTWTISLDHVSNQTPDAAELLRFLSFLSNQDIWYELIQAGAEGGPVWLGRVTTTKIRFDRAMSKLRDYSLVEVVPGSYRLHTCVRDWLVECFQSPPPPLSFLTAVNCLAKNVLDDSHVQHLAVGRRLLDHFQMLNCERLYPLWDAHVADSKVWGVIDTFGGLYNIFGQTDEAQAVHERAFAVRKKLLGQQHQWTLGSMMNLGSIYTTNGDYTSAENMYQQVLASLEIRLRSGHSATVDKPHDVESGDREHGKTDELVERLLQAISECERAQKSDKALALRTINALGSLYLTQDKLDEAERMSLRALNGYIELFGPEDESTFRPMRSLGMIYREQGNMAKAEDMCQRCLSGQEKVLGPDNDQTLDSASNLALVYMDQGKLSEAEELFVRVLAGYRLAPSVPPPTSTVQGLTAVLAQAIRTNNTGSEDKRSLLVKLVHHFDEWGREDGAVMHYLARAFISSNDDANAEVALLHLYTERSDSRDFGTPCASCSTQLTSDSGLHACRQCPNTNLCNVCLSLRQANSLSLPTCSTHEFFNLANTLTKAREETDWQARMDLDRWIERLKSQYPAEGDE